MTATIRAIRHAFPREVVTTEQLAAAFPEWSAEKILTKTGIRERHVAGSDECSSDLGFAAATQLFREGVCAPDSIDFLLLCTQTPDYFLPTTACLLQDRLGLPTTCGALDFNLGCSGYIYGLGLAQGLISTGQAKSLLLITAETYSKFLNPRDRGGRTIFGDAAAATWITGSEQEDVSIGPFVYGTDGSGGPNLMVPAGGMRRPKNAETSIEAMDESGNIRSEENIFMNGPEIFAFTMEAVPPMISTLLKKAALGWDDIDLVIFHQANQYMLNYLRTALKIVPEKFYLAFENCGNTVSSSIPIALQSAVDAGKVRPGSRVLIAGYGVGYSWGATLVRWKNS